MANKTLIPSDFQRYLPEMKEKSYKWKMEYTSQSDLKSVGHITHYSITDAPHANIILVPGLASNTESEPLMQAITYWALKFKHDVYAIDTFLANFKPDVRPELARQNTFPEFIKLMDTGLNILEKLCHGKWTTIVAHSAGATGTFEIFNRRIKANKKLHFNGAIMFAPYINQDDGLKRFIDLYRARYRYTELSDAEFLNTPLGFGSPHDHARTKRIRYVTIYPQFVFDMAKTQTIPEIMNQYNIPITIVGAGHDNKVKYSALYDLYQQLRAQPNGNLFNFVTFDHSKHSFLDQHKNWSAIIELLHAQMPKRR